MMQKYGKQSETHKIHNFMYSEKYTQLRKIICEIMLSLATIEHNTKMHNNNAQKNNNKFFLKKLLRIYSAVCKKPYFWVTFCWITGSRA